MPKILKNSNEIIIDSLVNHHRIIKALQQIRDNRRRELIQTNGSHMIQRRMVYLQQWLNLAHQSVNTMAQINAQMSNDQQELKQLHTIEDVDEWSQADDMRLPALEQRIVDTLIVTMDDKIKPKGAYRYVLPVKTTGNLDPRDINLYQLNRYLISNVKVIPTRLKIIHSPIDGQRIYVEVDTKAHISKYDMYEVMYEYVNKHIQYHLSTVGTDKFAPTSGMDFQMLRIN